MTFSETLLRWYDTNRRSLPWRGAQDPYAVWLSEIMLQQTRAETVRGYYTRFLDRFPDVHALANAPEESFPSGSNLPSPTPATMPLSTQ